MKKLIFLSIVALFSASVVFAASNITGSFSVDGTTIVQRPSGELYVSEGGLTTTAASVAAVSSTVTTNNNTFKSYTATERPVFGGYSRNQIVCWKTNRTIGFCTYSTVEVNGRCVCK